ncbi:MAG: hypothetical protein Q4F80_09255, partial [bacterium]|nr:hypothetical protein [bacterium]
YREFLRGNEEIIAYNLIDDLENLYEAIESFDADIFYAKLQHRKFPLFVLKMAYNYDISMIRTNKDVII